MAIASKFGSFWENSMFHRIILFTLTFLLYSNTLSHEYTQDDAIVIYDNMFTTEGLSGIPGILQNDTFYGFFKKEGKDKLVSGGRYRPLSQIMFALEWELFENSPFVGHLMNVLCFALLVILLYQVLLCLFRGVFREKDVFIFSFLASILFAVHPIHTEVVANIKGRDEIMSLLFSLGSLWLILKGIDAKKYSWIYFAAPVFFLALLSKENAITFIAVIPVALYLFRKVEWKGYLAVFISLFISTFIFLIIRTSILGLDFGNESLELMNNPFLKIEGSKYIPFTFGERIATIFYTLLKYIQLLIFPHPLTHDYYPRQIAIMDITDWQVILSVILYLGMLVFSLIYLKKRKVISFSILYFLLTLSIVSNIVFPIGTNMSERFLFMPSVGFVILVAYLLLRLRKMNNLIATTIALSVFVLFSFKTISRNNVWKDDFTLFTTDVKTSKNSAKVLNAAGGSLVTEAAKISDGKKKDKMLRDAVNYLNRALSIHPNYKNAYLIKGNAHYYLQEYEEGIKCFENVLVIAPGYQEAKKNLAVTHREAGKNYGMVKNDLSKAIQHLTKAYEMMPEDYESVRLLGIAYAFSGNNKKSLELFHKGIELAPGNAGAFINLGNLYHNMGNIEMAKIQHARALELDPDIFEKKE